MDGTNNIKNKEFTKKITYSEYLNLRNKIISNFFEGMNDKQLEAILTVRGAQLILAGAGSGKTTVIVNRIANILKYGLGLDETEVDNLDENDCNFLINYDHERDYLNSLTSKLIFCNIPNPWNILAITFTNKAANELKTRLEKNLSEEIVDSINASTFHSACVKILRKNADKIGYDRNFTIYDTYDTKNVISDIIDNMKLDVKLFPVKSVISKISAAKNNLISPEELLDNEEINNYKISTIAKIYAVYQDELRKSNALDFDDIIQMTVRLFQEMPQVLEYYQNKFKYIMVDEYQDTNHAQFKLIYLLSKSHNNICVVGDDDQSIYKFRGATVENILNFEKHFKNVKVIKLEQNYRSTKTILDVANAVIVQNFVRKGKQLWTSNETGEKITVYTAVNEYGEARFVVDTILDNIQKGYKYSDNAVLYRTNFQSNIIEQAFIKSGIPYKILGGLRFYDRKEIKDIIAYLSVINNYNDNLRLERIINEPKRGIGKTTIGAAQKIAQERGISLFEVMDSGNKYKELSKKSNILTSFCGLIKELIEIKDKIALVDFINHVLNKVGYLKYIEMLGKEGTAKLDNINQLIVNAQKYQNTAEMPTLEGFLEEISLYSESEIESAEKKDDETQVSLMTLHSAKGLEFPQVIIIGMEEGVFPGSQVVYDYKDLEEERRLAYVGFTRAKKNLYLVYAKERKIYNKTLLGVQSRFIDEIPKEYCNFISQSYPKEVKETKKYKTNVAINNAKVMNMRKMIGIGFKQPINNNGNGNPDFKVGCSVRHKVFGIGIVKKVVPIANDILLEIDFNKVGMKKIMANFAGIKICD